MICPDCGLGQFSFVEQAYTQATVCEALWPGKNMSVEGEMVYKRIEEAARCVVVEGEAASKKAEKMESMNVETASMNGKEPRDEETPH